jgi:hypothetical protein
LISRSSRGTLASNPVRSAYAVMRREGFENPVREPVVAHELPDVLRGVEFRALRRQWNQRDVGGHEKLVGEVPAGLVDQEYGVSARCHRGGNLGQMQVHRRCVAMGQNERRPLAVPGADGAEDIGRARALIARRRRPCATSGPSPGDLVLLSNPGFVGKPKLYASRLDAFVVRDRVQNGGEALLKSAIAPSACA